jgi:hypothetical protein
MSVFNATGFALAGLFAFSILLYLTVVGGVLAQHHARDAVRRWRYRQMATAVRR